MKAAVQERFGAPQVLKVQDVARPSIDDNQVLIEVHASLVTQGDRRLRAADYPGLSQVIGRAMFGFFRPRNPIPGTNFAGRVVAVGAKVRRFAVGEDVFGACDKGAYAEYLPMAEDAAMAKMPAGLDYNDAAAAPYGAMTALTFLRDVAKVQPDERVLIVGASGGVGRFAVQVARHLGAHVTGVCGPKNLALVKSLGANEVIDYQREEYWKNDRTYDVIFDTNAGDDFRRIKNSLNATGRFVTLYLNLLVLWQMLTSSLTMGPRVISSVALPNQALLQDVAELLAEGALSSVVARRYPLADIVEAHQALESQRPAGAIVVTINELKGTSAIAA